jgi:hypothetical protein
MTNVDQAEGEAVAITLHSRAATDTEILMTEFIACYLAAEVAWHYDGDHQELKKASKGTKGRQKRNVPEDNMLGFRSPMRGLPVSSTYALSAIPYLLLLIQIRLVSIHGRDIRVLTTYFTEEYYQSFKKADQSTSGSLHVRIESFRLPDDWEPQINHEIQRLMEPSTWLQELMKTSNK